MLHETEDYFDVAPSIQSILVYNIIIIIIIAQMAEITKTIVRGVNTLTPPLFLMGVQWALYVG